MKKSILLMVVLIALVSLCLVFASCDSGSSDSSDPTPPPEPAPVTYTVSFNANGGSETMDSGSVVEGETYTIPENKFTEPAGTLRSFAGWNTKADGSGTAYAAEGTIPATDITADITLYAQWTKPLFSVSATKKVYFSKGNLYWDGSKYQFEAKQCDYRHYNGKTNDKAVINGEITTTPSGTVGSFFWVKSTEIKPYDASYNEFFAANSGAIEGWDVLSSAEWEYLLNTDGSSGRSDANRFAKARVNGVNGLLIFPDGYDDLPSGYTADGGTGMAKVNEISSTDDSFPSVEIPDATWSEMESSGVVFLPAAGNRNDSSINGVGSDGCYWSSTPNEYNPDYAYLLVFVGSDVNLAESAVRGGGCSVRLVCGEN